MGDDGRPHLYCGSPPTFCASGSLFPPLAECRRDTTGGTTEGQAASESASRLQCPLVWHAARSGTGVNIPAAWILSIRNDPQMPSRHADWSPPAGMKVCHVHQDEYPWDIRIEKISDSLARAGHETVIVSRNRSGLPRRQQLDGGVKVIRLPIGWTTFDRNLMNFPAFFSPWWLWSIVRAVQASQLDLILVRDLPLAPTAVWAGRVTGTPVVMDMAENYPAMLQATWAHRPPNAFDRIVRNPDLLRQLERWILPQLDGILVVSKASQDRVVSLTAERVPVWVVGNTPRLERQTLDVRSDLADRIAAHPGLVLLYVGNMDAKRGLDTVVRALPIIKRSDPRVLAVIVGKGTEERKLRSMAAELGVSDNVLMPGWVDQREVPSIVAASDIGLIPHRLSEHTDTTIPNKIYDYMAKGLPVVVTPCRSLLEIVESNRCGVAFPDGDHVGLASAVQSLADAEVRERLGSSGRQAISERFNWDQDTAVLLNALEQSHARSERRRKT